MDFDTVRSNTTALSSPVREPLEKVTFFNHKCNFQVFFIITMINLIADPIINAIITNNCLSGNLKSWPEVIWTYRIAFEILINGHAYVDKNIILIQYGSQWYYSGCAVVHHLDHYNSVNAQLQRWLPLLTEFWWKKRKTKEKLCLLLNEFSLKTNPEKRVNTIHNI